MHLFKKCLCSYFNGNDVAIIYDNFTWFKKVKLHKKNRTVPDWILSVESDSAVQHEDSTILFFFFT